MKRLFLVLLCSLVMVQIVVAAKPRVEPIMPGVMVYDTGWLVNKSPFRVTFVITAPLDHTGWFSARFGEYTMIEGTDFQLRYRLNNGDWIHVFGPTKCIFSIQNVGAGDIIDCELRAIKTPKGMKEIEIEWWGRMPFIF